MVGYFSVLYHSIQHWLRTVTAIKTWRKVCVWIGCCIVVGSISCQSTEFHVSCFCILKVWAIYPIQQVSYLFVGSRSRIRMPQVSRDATQMLLEQDVFTLMQAEVGSLHHNHRMKTGWNFIYSIKTRVADYYCIKTNFTSKCFHWAVCTWLWLIMVLYICVLMVHSFYNHCSSEVWHSNI